LCDSVPRSEVNLQRGVRSSGQELQALMAANAADVVNF